MPHFVLDCSETILDLVDPDVILQEIHNTATASTLFTESDIKVRLNPFKAHYIVGGKKDDFIHIFANIMEGRTTNQKAELSRLMVSKLKALFPDVPVLSINIRDFEKATYCNKAMI